MMNYRRTSVRSAFTLVELLVVIAMIGILVGLTLPAIQSAREAARRVSCTNNMVQLSLALSNYHLTHGYLPAGTVNDKGPIVHTPVGFHHSWVVQLLPMLDQSAVYRQVKHDQSIYAAANANIRVHGIANLGCPSSPNGNGSGVFSNYAGVHNSIETPIDTTNDGIFFLNGQLTYDDISDGLSYTLALGEKDIDLTELGWSSGTRASLRNLGSPISMKNPSTGFVGNVPVGVVLAGGDGKFFDNDQDGLPDDIMEPQNGVLLSSGSPPFGMGMGTEGVITEDVVEPTQWTAYPGDPSTWLPISALPTIVPGRPNSGSDVGGFSSWHSAVVHFAAADGAVRPVSCNADRAVLLRMANRHDGQLTKSIDGL